MAIVFNQWNNEIVIDGKRIGFNYKIRYVKEVNDILIVLLEIPNDSVYLNNVFGINKIGEIKWRIHTISEIAPIKNQLPFENLMVNGDNVCVSDFYGRRFLLNTDNGEASLQGIVR